MDEHLQGTEIHYRTIFENSPISFWEEDFSEVKKYIDGLREQGVVDLRAHFDANPDALVECYSLIKVLDVSQRTLEWYEAETKEELFAGLAEKVFTEESDKVLKEEILALAEGKLTFRSEMFGRTLKGNDLHTDLFVTVVPGYEDTWGKVLICDVDITEQKRLEQELKIRSERQTALRSLSQNFLKEMELRPLLDKAIQVIEKSLDLEFVVILECREDPGSLALRAGTDAVALLTGIYETGPEEDSLFAYCLASRQSVIVDDLPAEKRFTCPALLAGHHLSNGLSVLIGDEDNPWGILAAFSARRRNLTDDTVNFVESVARLLSMAIERSKVQEEQNRLAAAIDQTAELVVITNSRGIIQYANPAFERLTGYPAEDLLGRNVVSLNHGRENTEITEAVQKHMRADRVWNGQFICRKKDGSLLTLEATISPVRDRYQRTTNFVAVMRDITEYLELENRLRHSQKVQAIGTLAGGIAHDFNNILAGIIGFTDLAEECAPREGELRDMLYEISLGARRARELVRQILTFSRKGEHAWKPIKIQPIVGQAIKLLRNAIPATIAINSKVSEDCGYIQGNESQIHQVIINLCSNGYQAMLSKGGTLDILVDEIHLDATAAREKDLKAGSFVRIRVNDTGHGMDEATMARIFEPYFTTKEVGLGTGLGLSTVLGIVETHGGKITVESVPDEGSQFEVLLPVYSSKDIDPAPHKEVEGQDETPPVGKGEHILFVDDEEPIVKFSQTALARYGYQVTGFVNSEEALDAFRNRPDRFDLVITDQMMPKMTGMELAREVLQIRPEIPVILATGFSEGVNREEALAAGLRDFFTKPLSARELGQRIQRALVNR